MTRSENIYLERERDTVTERHTERDRQRERHRGIETD